MFRYAIVDGIVRLASDGSGYGWFARMRQNGGFTRRLEVGTALYDTHAEAEQALLARTSPEEK